MPFVVPQFIIMTATCVFVFCSAIVKDVEVPQLNKIDKYSAKIYNSITMSYKAESQTCPDDGTRVELTYIDHFSLEDWALYLSRAKITRGVERHLIIGNPSLILSQTLLAMLSVVRSASPVASVPADQGLDLHQQFLGG